MHIVIDARMIDASGIGIYLKNILNNIPDGYEITLLGDPYKLQKYKLNFNIIPLLAPIYSIKEQLALINLIPNCDIFWSPHYNIPLLPIKAKKRLVTIHDVCHLALGEQLSLMKRLYAKLVIKGATKLSDKIITVSEFSKDEIIKYTGCESKKINVIYNGINNFKIKAAFDSIDLKYQLPENYILFVGNVKPHKNLRKLLEAYLLLSNSLQQKFKIVIVGKKNGFITGDTALFAWIAQNSTLYENIIFTGFVEENDMGALYQSASIFVFPTLYEGFGLPPLEAMANNCPVVVSNISCLPEICEDAVFYFNPYDAVSIAGVITEVLTDPVKQAYLINKGKIHFNQYSWKKSAQLHMDLFNDI